MTKDDLLKNYFKKSLSKKDEEEFFMLLDTDRDFKAQYNEYLDFNLAFKSHEANELKDFLKSIDKKSITKKTTRYKKSAFYYAAAAVLVLALCVSFLLKPSSNSLYENYFEVYPNVEQPIVRGSEDTTFTNAFKFYENGDYTSAEKEFETILKTIENPNYKFYYAMSLLNNEKFDKALQQLNQIQNSDYEAEINWYKALIYLKKEDVFNATKYLQAIASKSTFKTKEAKILLAKIND